VTRVPVRQSSAMRDEKALKMSRKTWRVSECLLTRTKTCTERTEDARQKIDPYSRLSRHARRQYVTRYSRVPDISLLCGIFAQIIAPKRVRRCPLRRDGNADQPVTILI